MPDDRPQWAVEIGELLARIDERTANLAKTLDGHILDKQIHQGSINGRKWLYLGLGIGAALAGGGVGGGLLQLVAVAGG